MDQEQGIKRKRDEEVEQQDVMETKHTRKISPQNRFDTSVMPVSAKKSKGDYQLLQKMGEGTFGLWYKAKDKATHQIVAIRKVRRYSKSWDDGDLRHTNISLALVHRHLRLVFDVVSKPHKQPSEESEAVYLIAEYCDCALLDLMRGTPFDQVSEGRIKSILHQLLLAVDYLHKNNVMHRDIKPGKVFFKDGEVKLSTTSLIREYTRDVTLSPEVVTLWYRAPELLLSTKHYDFAIDMWSVGCVMAELFMGRPLFPGDSEIQMLMKIPQVLGPVKDHTWPELADLSPAASKVLRTTEARTSLSEIIPRLSRSAHDLLRGLLCYNPRDRLTARQALQHEWFSDLTPELLRYKVLPYITAELLD